MSVHRQLTRVRRRRDAQEDAAHLLTEVMQCFFDVASSIAVAVFVLFDQSVDLRFEDNQTDNKKTRFSSVARP